MSLLSTVTPFSKYNRNVDGKAVVRGFSLPVVISEEMKAEEANRLAVRSALQSAFQLKANVVSVQPPPVVHREGGVHSEDREDSADDDPLTRENPAYLAGVRLNDVIMSVNNTDARSSSFEQILRALTGNTYTPRTIEDTDINNITTATSGIVHPCHGQPSGSRGMAVAAVDHIVCVTFARSQSIRADSCKVSVQPTYRQNLISSSASTSSSSRSSSSSDCVLSSSSSSSLYPKAQISTSVNCLTNEDAVEGGEYDSDSDSEIEEGGERDRRRYEKSKINFSKTVRNHSDFLLSHPVSQMHENNVEEMAENSKDDNDPSHDFTTMPSHPPPATLLLPSAITNSNNRPRRGPRAR